MSSLLYLDVFGLLSEQASTVLEQSLKNVQINKFMHSAGEFQISSHIVVAKLIFEIHFIFSSHDSCSSDCWNASYISLGIENT
jgi:hypothetical protein